MPSSALPSACSCSLECRSHPAGHPCRQPVRLHSTCVGARGFVAPVLEYHPYFRCGARRSRLLLQQDAVESVQFAVLGRRYCGEGRDLLPRAPLRAFCVWPRGPPRANRVVAGWPQYRSAFGGCSPSPKWRIAKAPRAPHRGLGASGQAVEISASPPHLV